MKRAAIDKPIMETRVKRWRARHAVDHGPEVTYTPGWSHDAWVQKWSQPGRFRKERPFGCSCKMCKYEKHFGVPTIAELRARQREEEQLSEVA